jgi:cytochrome P450
MFAPKDTTAVTLSYAAWLIIQSPSVLSRLRAEISTVMPDPTSLPNDLSTLEALPYLTACIYETMRLFPAIPGPFPRMVPKDGLEIGGYALPAGTIVGANAYAVHRAQPEIWGDNSEIFCPERWVDPTADISAMRKALYVPQAVVHFWILPYNFCFIYSALRSVLERGHVLAGMSL